MQLGYVTTTHPVTGERIQVIPTGQTRTTPEGTEAEFTVLTPGSNLTLLWLKRGELFKE